MPRRKLWNVSDLLRHQPYRRLLNFLKNISPIGTYLSRIPVNVINAIAAMGSDLPQFTVPIFMRVSCLVQGQSEGEGAHQPRSLPAGLPQGPVAGIPGCCAA